MYNLRSMYAGMSCMIEHVPSIIEMRRGLVMMNPNFLLCFRIPFQILKIPEIHGDYSAERADWQKDLM